MAFSCFQFGQYRHPRHVFAHYACNLDLFFRINLKLPTVAGTENGESMVDPNNHYRAISQMLPPLSKSWQSAYTSVWVIGLPFQLLFNAATYSFSIAAHTLNQNFYSIFFREWKRENEYLSCTCIQMNRYFGTFQ